MTLIFFQNCISPHQIPYIRECSKNKLIKKIYIIVPRINYQYRSEMGWDGNEYINLPSINVIIKPIDNQIKNILYENKCVCLFSGLRADKLIFKWFKLSLSYDIKRYIISEPPFIYNKPLILHYIRFYLFDYKYIKYINGVFAIGDLAYKYYSNISKKWNVYPFQYVTESLNRYKPIPKGNVKFIFVGSLIKRKNVKIILKAIKGINNTNLTIIGNGPMYKSLKESADKNNIKINFLGYQKQNKILDYLQEHDILILPSLYDGWGAVVNEAMTLGLYVIVSNNCGSKALIRDKIQGEIFNYKSHQKLKEIINNCINSIDSIRNNTYKRIELSKKIQAPHVSYNFIRYLLSDYNNEKRNCLDKYS